MLYFVRLVALAGFETRWAEEAEILGDKDESDRMIAKQTYLSKANHFCVFSQLNGFGQELHRPGNCNNCLAVRSFNERSQQKFYFNITELKTGCMT